MLLGRLPENVGFVGDAVDWASLTAMETRTADSGWHATWHNGGIDHQFWFAEPFDAATSYAALLPFDSLFELRVHAARRLWRAFWGRPPGGPYRMMPDQLRQLHILTLRALDARLSGASYRMIAEVLLGFRGKTKNDWEIDPRKNKVRRLVAAGKRLMWGDYRLLLRYPIKLPHH